MKSQDWKNKVVVITGASSGIGESLALELASRGAKLALLARRTERLEKVSKDIEARGGRAIAVRCDVSVEEDNRAAAATVAEKLGPADAVVVNAGFSVAGNFEYLTLQDYRRQMDTNVFGAMATSYAFLPQLKQTRGELVLVGSVMSYLSLPGTTAYGMSKYALRAFFEGIETELSRYGIHCLFVAPGFIATEIRKVDNQGQFSEKNDDDVPMWLQMPADKAARIIERAMYRRKRLQIVTLHAHAFIWIARHTPWIFRTVSRLGFRRRRGRDLSAESAKKLQ